MSDNRVQVRITGKDELSGVIRSIRGGIASNIGAAVATVAALSAGVAVAGLAIANLGTGLSKSMDLQTQQITTAYSLATVIGSTVSDAKKATKELNMEMATLGDTLPGVTEDYQKFAQTLSATVGIASGGSLDKYKAVLTEVSKYGGLMVATSGADGNQGASALNRYLGGTMSQGEARTQDIFAKNPNYKLFEAQAMQQMKLAGQDFQKQLSTSQRIAVFNLANSLMFTPQMLAAYGATADTQLQALKSKLFNPSTGIFGFSREIKGLGNKTALDTVTGLLIQIDGMSISAGKWLAANGINLDPMEAIGNMMNAARDWTAAFDALIQGDKSGVKMMLNNLKRGLGSIKIEDFVGAVNTTMRILTSMIEAVNWKEFGEGLGDNINKAIATFDWVGAEAMLSKALNGFFDGITGVLNRVISKPINEGLGRLTGGKLGGDEGKKAYEANPRRSTHFTPSNPSSGTPAGGIDMPVPKTGRDGRPISSLPSLGQMSSKGGGGAFSPQINITGGNADSMQQTADYILTAINNQYMQYRDAALV